jgi:hypothetical protein
MNVKINILTVIIVALALAAEIFAIVKVFNDNRRLSDNFAALAAGTAYYRINDSISAAQSQRILADNAQIKAYFPEIQSAIGQMNVKLRQLERYSAINSNANYQIVTKIYRDTVLHQSPMSPVAQPSLPPQPQYTEYHDRWIDFRQAIVADTAYTSIQTRDSIAIVQSWTRPHRFWFLRWGRKRHTQTVTNANPNAKITYSIYVEKP